MNNDVTNCVNTIDLCIIKRTKIVYRKCNSHNNIMLIINVYFVTINNMNIA